MALLTKRTDAGTLRIDRADHAHVDAVLLDLRRIAATPSGRALLRDLHQTGYGITIRKPPTLDPPNAWITTDAERGGANMLVLYDPADWPSAGHPIQLPSDLVLFSQLLRARGEMNGATGFFKDEANLLSQYGKERAATGRAGS